MTTTERIQQLVRQFLQDHSGGEKFIAVLTFIISGMLATDTPVEPNEVEAAIRAMPDVQVLDYGWRMGQAPDEQGEELWREKMFIYTPMP